ncbi:Invasion associated protein p60 [hydrothermal vent metagenome]|uniref:Invasion associated protein p60 n=1 Tax=hydrothermal vent metagenome TaxID=652676 RepID=A0A1W1BU83_9ZZZZ
MIKLYIFFLLLFFSVAVSASTIKIKTHTIKNGETLYTIAHANHTTIEEVREANGLKKGEILKIGQVLKVPQDTYFPEKKKSVKATQKFINHTVKNGEILYTIAHANHTTIEEVREANGLKEGEILKIGRVLKVPQDTYFPEKKKSVKATQKFVNHTVKNGEILYTIAHANHTTIEEVREANGLKEGEILKIGRVLKVPQNTYFPHREKKVKTAAKKVKKKAIHHFVKYRIKRGETLYSIAHANHTTIAEVEKANDLKRGEMLKVGRVLKVPISKLATTTHKKRVRIAKTDRKSNKKLVASLEPLERISLKKTKAKKQKSSFSFRDIFFSRSSSKSSKITSLAKKKLGRRYVWGATGEKNTFDCSGFTTYVYKKNGINLPRRAIAQSKYGKYVSRKNLKKGDLVFFDTSKRHRGYVNHVGIYLGNGKFIHASSAKKKVIITSLNKKFYSQRYKGARRPS